MNLGIIFITLVFLSTVFGGRAIADNIQCSGSSPSYFRSVCTNSNYCAVLGYSTANPSLNPCSPLSVEGAGGWRIACDDRQCYENGHPVKDEHGRDTYQYTTCAIPDAACCDPYDFPEDCSITRCGVVDNGCGGTIPCEPCPVEWVPIMGVKCSDDTIHYIAGRADLLGGSNLRVNPLGVQFQVGLVPTGDAANRSCARYKRPNTIIRALRRCHLDPGNPTKCTNG